MDFKFNYQKFIIRKLANLIKNQLKYTHMPVYAPGIIIFIHFYSIVTVLNSCRVRNQYSHFISNRSTLPDCFQFLLLFCPRGIRLTEKWMTRESLLVQLGIAHCSMAIITISISIPNVH